MAKIQTPFGSSKKELRRCIDQAFIHLVDQRFEELRSVKFIFSDKLVKTSFHDQLEDGKDI